MKTTETGRTAEAEVAKFLKAGKYSIVAQNWRTRTCEIDIIAKKDGVVYFVEVKYRSSNAQGDGFAYVTVRKQHQMRYAAEVWVQENDGDGDYRLMAAAVSEQGVSILEL